MMIINNISSTSGKNSLRVPIVIYADFECLLFKMDSCEKCPDNSYTEKRSRHIPCGYSLTTCYSYVKTLNVYIIKVSIAWRNI